jgi:hypothetical protein
MSSKKVKNQTRAETKMLKQRRTKSSKREVLISEQAKGLPPFNFDSRLCS